MIKYNYKVYYTSKFKKSLKKVLKQEKNIDKLLNIVDRLANNEELEPQYKNHKLVDDKIYKNCGECHIEPDWLLIYQYNNDELILILVNTGSHSEVLNK